MLPISFLVDIEQFETRNDGISIKPQGRIIPVRVGQKTSRIDPAPILLEEQQWNLTADLG